MPSSCVCPYASSKRRRFEPRQQAWQSATIESTQLRQLSDKVPLTTGPKPLEESMVSPSDQNIRFLTSFFSAYNLCLKNFTVADEDWPK
jgi:hypothetical protein